MQRDSRSTAELIEIAKIEFALDASEPVPATVALQERGTREVFDAAVALCGSANPEWRAVGATILGQLGSPHRTYPNECCGALLDLLRHDPDEGVLEAAVFALAHLGSDDAHNDLIALRNHRSATVRRGVAMGLNGTTSHEGVETLLNLMNDPSAEVRDWATTIIGETVAIDGPRVREALVRRATDEDEITRSEALHGLARRQDERVVPYLIAELRAKRERSYLFNDAAKTYLGQDEAAEIPCEELQAALQRIVE